MQDHYKERLLKKFLPLVLYSSAITIVLKLRVLGRLPYQQNVFEKLAYCFQDQFVLIVFFTIFALLKRGGTFLSFLVFLVSVINILSISKLGYPLTTSLFSQVGDLLFIQTSVASPGVLRNVILLVGIALSFWLVVWLLTKKSSTVFGQLSLSAVTLLLGISGFSYGSLRPVKLHQNFMTSFFKRPSTVREILSRDEFKKGKVEKTAVPEAGSRLGHHVVIVVMETLSTEALEGKIEQVMPTLSQLKEEGISLDKHFTSWPFSSKSLYSLFCGQLNYPSYLIEFRLLENFPCRSWVTPLVEDGKGRIFYSGDLNYDKMGKFFKQIGIISQTDRGELSKLAGYKSNELSVDDKSMLAAFESRLGSEKEKSLNIFLTMNSHFPFWNPSGEKTFDSVYDNALSYQDQFLKELIGLLKSKGVYEETILVVTGDHGKRESVISSSLLPKSMFTVPFVMRVPGQKRRAISHPTNHYQVGELITLLDKKKGIENSRLFREKESFLFFETDERYYSLVKENEVIVYEKGKIYYDRNWPSIQSKTCTKDVCPEYFVDFKKYFLKMYELYEK